MSKVTDIIADVHHLFGHEVGVSDWILIDQKKIDDHAGFHQRQQLDAHGSGHARPAESPFGKPIAQSFLVLACLTDMVSAVEIPAPRHRLPTELRLRSGPHCPAGPGGTAVSVAASS